MKDRVPLYPGRVTLTPVAGQANTYDMVRADQPTQEGTPLNKANLLADDVAAKLGLTGDPTPNDALDALADQKASKQQAAADAGKFWKIGTDGLLVFDSPVAKFSQGPLIITTSQTLDLSQYGLKIGDQINVACIGAGGGGGGGVKGVYDSASAHTGGGRDNRTKANNGRGYGSGGGGAAGKDQGGPGGGGGACGAIAVKTITLTSLSVVVTIGTMGTGGTPGVSGSSGSSAGDGGNGGTTSFGAYLSAAGGKGGTGGQSNDGTYTAGAGATGQHNGGNGGRGYLKNEPYGGGGGAGGWIVASITVFSGTDGADASSRGDDGAGGTPNGLANAGDGAVLIWW